MNFGFTPSYMSLGLEIAEIFDVAQKRPNKRNTKNLQKLMQNNTVSDFTDEFMRQLALFMPAKNKATEVKRLIKFTSDFIESIDAEQYFEFTDAVLNSLVFGASAKEKQVRVHCISLAVSILKYLKSLDPDMYEEIKAKFSKGLNDNEAHVRQSAVEGCCVLMRADEADNYLDVLTDILQTDPSAEVRKKIIEDLVLNQTTMPFIFARIRDIDEGVRKAVLRRTAEGISDFTSIPQEWRVKLLTFGFCDRSKVVYKEAELLLLNKWLPSIDLNFLRFVVESGLKDINVLKKILVSVLHTFQDTKFVFDDEFWYNITFESILLLESYLSILTDNNEDVTDCLPQLTVFVDILQEYIKTFLKSTVEEQEETIEVMIGLLKIHRFYDNGDVFGTNKLYGLAREVLLLPRCPLTLVNCLITILKFSTDSITEYSACLIELFNTIKDTSEQSEINKRFSLSFNDINDSTAATNEVDPKYQSLVVLKGLKLLSAIFSSDITKIKEWFDISEIMNSILLPYLQDSNADLKTLALECLGILCIAYEQLAVENIIGLSELIFKSSLPIREMALQIVMDLLTVHFDALSAVKELNINNILLNCLNTRKDTLLALAVEGITKLIIKQKVNDSNLVENLLILYFHPRTNKLQRTRQCLAYLFSGYTQNVENTMVISELLVPVLLKLFQIHLQHSTMLDPVTIAVQLLDWINPNKCACKVKGFQFNIVVKVLSDCFKLNTIQTKYYCSILNKFDLQHTNDEQKSVLVLYIDHLMQQQEDSAILMLLKRFKTQLNKSITKYYKISPSIKEDVDKIVNKLLGTEDLMAFGTPNKSMIE